MDFFLHIEGASLITTHLLLRAVNEARTRDPQLGKLMLYQLSYYRIAMETAQN